MFFATVRFTVAKNPDKCPNLRTVGNYMGNCRKKRTSQITTRTHQRSLSVTLLLVPQYFSISGCTIISQAWISLNVWKIQLVRYHLGCHQHEVTTIQRERSYTWCLCLYLYIYYIYIYTNYILYCIVLYYITVYHTILYYIILYHIYSLSNVQRNREQNYLANPII